MLRKPIPWLPRARWSRPRKAMHKGTAPQDAEADIDWLDAQVAIITEQDLDAAMSAEKLGEYQE